MNGSITSATQWVSLSMLGVLASVISMVSDVLWRNLQGAPFKTGAQPLVPLRGWRRILLILVVWQLIALAVAEVLMRSAVRDLAQAALFGAQVWLVITAGILAIHAMRQSLRWAFTWGLLRQVPMLLLLVAVSAVALLIIGS